MFSERNGRAPSPLEGFLGERFDLSVEMIIFSVEWLTGSPSPRGTFGSGGVRVSRFGPGFVLFACALLFVGAFSGTGFAYDLSLDGEWSFKPIAAELMNASETERIKKLRAPELDDSGWKKISVPGYWDQPPGAFPWSNPNLPGGPFPDHDGEGWYRLRFAVPANAFPSGSDATGSADFHAALVFEGVSAYASVWLNGTFLGRHLGAFSSFELNASSAILKGATNILAVRVLDKTVYHNTEAANPNGTSEIPLGFDSKSGGISRGVLLRVTPKERILSTSVDTRLDAVSVEVLVSPEAVEASTLSMEILNAADGTTFYGPETEPVIAYPGYLPGLTFHVTDLAPKPWSPEEPNLYRIRLNLTNRNGVVDSREITIGFRTFTSADGAFHLNGRPYFLLGAGSPPHYENPPEVVARKHLEQLKAAGVRMVRFAHEPPSETWLRLCDEIGLMAWIEGPLSADRGPYDFAKKSFVDHATRELISMVRVSGAHPSAAIWTAGAGNSRALQGNPESREAAAGVLGRMADLLAGLDRPRKTPPRLADSRVEFATSDRIRVTLPESDCRLYADSQVEDWHSDLGWYERKTADWGPYLEAVARRGEGPGAPWVCSQIETGYSTSGQGKIIPDPIEEAASRMRIGSSADESGRLLTYQSERIRRLLETARGMRDPKSNRIAGLFPFTSANWFFNPLTPTGVQPKPILEAIERAYRPVILTIDLPKKRYYSGEVLLANVTVVNDQWPPKGLPAGTLTLEVAVTPNDVAKTQLEIPEIPYGQNETRRDLALTLPRAAEFQSSQVAVRYLVGDQEIAANRTPIGIADPAYCAPSPDGVAKDLRVYDPKGVLAPLLKERKVEIPPLGSLEELKTCGGLIFGPGAFDNRVAAHWAVFSQWVQAGGRVFVFPQEEVRSRWRFSGPYPGDHEVHTPEGWPTGIDQANVRVEDHPLFRGLGFPDLNEWGTAGVVATRTLRRKSEDSGDGTRTLADVVVSSRTPVWEELAVEVQVGEGTVLLCQLEFAEKVAKDPVAALLLRNVLEWAGGAVRPILAGLPENLPPFEDPSVAQGEVSEIHAEGAGAGEADPIRAIPAADGVFEATNCVDLSGVAHPGLLAKPVPNSEEKRIYYDIDDRFWPEQGGPAVVEVWVCSLDPTAEIRLDYDSMDESLGSLAPYKKSAPSAVHETRVWKALVFSLPDARFGNRQPDRCDFRLTTLNGTAVFGPITLRRAPPP